MGEKQIDKVDILLKSLARNDAYISNVNTKSTISLSFSAAIIAAVGLNYSRIVETMECGLSEAALSVFVILSVLAFLTASIFSLKVVRPNLKLSDSVNNFSFVEITSNHKSANSYMADVEKEDYDSFLKNLCALNFNISKIVMHKNMAQNKALYSMEVGAISLVFALLVVVFDQLGKVL